MECRSAVHKAYLHHFREKIFRERIPVSGTIELTHRCNLRCVHCYLGPHPINQGRNGEELTTKKLLDLIDEITEAGCLSLLITGGEPLLRSDFDVVYNHSKKRGMLVTIFTNGTLLNEGHVELFRDLPPQCIEISLYGATAATYERITGVAGSYEKCLRGIETLRENAVNLRLKTILMTINSPEFYEMKKLAESFQVKFRFDPAIQARFNGDKTPVGLRVPAEEAVRKQLAEDKDVRELVDYVKRYSTADLPDTLYYCGAGIFLFHIDPYGNLQPCMMNRSLRYDLRNGSFMDGWRDSMIRIRDRKVDVGFKCNMCRERDLCGYCPAFFELENGSPEIPAEYHCALSRNRYKMIQERVREGL